MEELKKEIIAMINQISNEHYLRRLYLILVVIAGTDH